MIDYEKPQAWFVTIANEDVFHVDLLVIQGTLQEAITKCRFLSERTGCLCKIHALTADTIPVNADWTYKAAAEAGMLLREVARVNRNYDFDTWRSAFQRVMEKLSPDQRQAELISLAGRITKELTALQIQAEHGRPTPPEVAAPIAASAGETV